LPVGEAKFTNSPATLVPCGRCRHPVLPAGLPATGLGVNEDSPQGELEKKRKSQKSGRCGLRLPWRRKGGKVRAEKLTPEQRSEIARKVVLVYPKFRKKLPLQRNSW